VSDPAEIRLQELRFRLRGELYEPGDAGFEEACTPFDPTVEQRPRLVARCSAPEDVVAALAFARQQDLAVAVRGDGDLVIDVRGMRDVDVDPERGVARVGAGATWAEVEAATGLTAEDLLAAQLVTLEGEIVRVEVAENPDLLVTLREGGGDFGVVTSMELRLPSPAG
jgi:FAD/FMN-containing dehydrogenase